MELFVREVKNIKKYNEFVNKVNKQLNLYTLPFISSKKIVKLYDKKYEEEYLVYRFYLIKEWIRQNEVFNKTYINELQEILECLLLTENLNGYELDYIDYYNQVIFSKTRNLKNLLVDFDVLQHEEVYYKFDIDILGQYRGNDVVDILFEKNEIFITNQRIVTVDKENYYSIFFNNIKMFKLKNSCLEIEQNNGIIIWVFADNVHSIYVALERILKMVNTKRK